MLAEQLDYVIGVDTHRDLHALAVVCAVSGGVLWEAEIEAAGEGYRKGLTLARERAPGRRAFAIEGTGSYGAGLTRFLEAAGERVLEVGRAPREGRRSRAKSDRLDAIRAARRVLGQERLPLPRAGGKRQELRALVLARAGALAAKQAALCQLRSLLVCSPERLRAQLRALTRARLLARCARLPDSGEEPGTRLALRLIARRILALQAEERALAQAIGSLVGELAPALLDEPGIGPISAAQLLLSWSHRGRLRSEAAFAHLGGTAPIPASSGQIVRHRLDPGGDRQLNRALHTIVVSRRKTHPPTIAYHQRRLREGKSPRETNRCLKRYLARHLYRLLEATAQTA
jgi:transposase